MDCMERQPSRENLMFVHVSSCVRNGARCTSHWSLTSLSSSVCILLEIVFTALLFSSSVTRLSFIISCAAVTPGYPDVILKLTLITVLTDWHWKCQQTNCTSLFAIVLAGNMYILPLMRN